jgi:hypothetical protein
LRTRCAIDRSQFVPMRPPALIERLLTPASWPQWQPEIVSVHGPRTVRGGDVVVGKARMLGFDVHGRAEMRTVEQNTVEHDVVVGIHMRVRYDVEPADGGAVLHHHLVADLPGGFWGRILSLFLRRRLRWMQRMALDNLTNGAVSPPKTTGRHRSADPCPRWTNDA